MDPNPVSSILQMAGRYHGQLRITRGAKAQRPPTPPSDYTAGLNVECIRPNQTA
jgi:hypothetical protein